MNSILDTLNEVHILIKCVFKIRFHTLLYYMTRFMFWDVLLTC